MAEKAKTPESFEREYKQLAAACTKYAGDRIQLVKKLDAEKVAKLAEYDKAGGDLLKRKGEAYAAWQATK